MFVFVWCEKWARIPYDLYPVTNPDWYSDHSSGRTPWALTANTHTHTHTHSFTHLLPDQLSIVRYTSHWELVRLSNSISFESFLMDAELWTTVTQAHTYTQA